MSRLKFQDKFATILDTLLENENFQINTQELSLLLDSAEKDNQEAKLLVENSDEFDSSLKYKDESLKLFTYLDRLYTKDYPQVIKTIGGHDPNRTELVTKLLTPTTDSLKIIATKVIKTGNAILEKYKLHLEEIKN